MTATMLMFVILAACATLGAGRAVEPAAAAAAGEQPQAAQQEVLFREGGAFQLPCGVFTAPEFTKFEWFKDNVPLVLDKSVTMSSRDGSLAVSEARAGAEGVYECRATSASGVASTGPISVKRTYINTPKLLTKKHTPVKGEPYQLECPQVEAYPKAAIVWQRQVEGKLEPVVTVRTTAGPDGTLYFANVTDEDATPTPTPHKYLCTVPAHPALPAGEPLVVAEHTVEQLKDNDNSDLKPAVPQYLSKDMVVEEGDEVFIYCIYGGAVAPPDYKFEGADVNGDSEPASQRVTRHNRSKGRRLLIRRVLRQDQGAYSCSIVQPDGKTVTHTMRLTVLSAPSLSKKPEAKTSAKVGEKLVIPCRAEGVPEPKITWTYNGKPLAMSDRMSILPKDANDSAASGAVADLQILALKKEDSGYYGCRASNDRGIAYNETLLHVA